MQTQTAKPYNGMSGGLFDDTPLTPVQRNFNTKADILIDIARTMAYTMGGPGRDMYVQRLWTKIGRKGDYLPAFREFVEERVEWARKQASFMDASAEGTVGYQPGRVYRSSLKRECESAFDSIMDKWGDEGW